MAETISPVVYGGRTRRYWLVWALHALAATAAASVTGLVLGAVGRVLGAPWGAIGVVAVVMAAGVYALRDLFGLSVPLPDLKRQVPEWWRTFFSLEVASTLYGLGLGTAFFTSLRFGTYVVVAAIALSAGDPLLSAALCAPFGLGRSLALLVAHPEMVENTGQSLIGRLNGAASGLIALYGAVALLT